MSIRSKFDLPSVFRLAFGEGTQSDIRVCFTAAAPSGSWEIRARQVAALRTNWKATLSPRASDTTKFDLFVITKRVDPSWVQTLQRRGVPWVYDVVDSWQQPEDGRLLTSVDRVTKHFTQKWKFYQASGYLFPNRRMYEDFKSVVPQPHFIYHHFFNQLNVLPLRERVQKVGYQGELRFLGEWEAIIQRQCQKRGLQWVTNPSRLSDLDIGVAVRGGEHDSWIANRYKSNVKLANFYGAALPCLVSSKEDSYRETQCPGVTFFDSEPSFAQGLDNLLDYHARERHRHHLLKARDQFRIEKKVGEFENYFLRVVDSLKDQR